MKRGHILIVEDDPATLNVFETTLKSQGYYISTAQDARRGLAAALSEPPGLILMDYALPQKDGIALLKEIREIPEIHRIPVILITAVSMAEVIRQAIQYGVKDILIKPFDTNTLVERVTKCFPPPPKLSN